MPLLQKKPQFPHYSSTSVPSASSVPLVPPVPCTLSSMRRLLAWTVTLGLFGSAATVAYYQLLPCRSPILYRVGAFDDRFPVSAEEFHSALTAAADLWNTAAGREILREDPNGSLPVSTVYDARQQTADTLEALGLRLDEGEQSYNAVKAMYDTHKQSYENENTAYAAAAKQFTAQKEALLARIENAKADGITAEEAAVFTKESDALNTLVPRLQEQQTRLQRTWMELDGLRETINRLAAQQNDVIDDFSTIGHAVGNEYEAGVFVRERGQSRIDVFAFSNATQLHNLLAHEFGHALGLAHIENPDAIMYRLNQSKNEGMTETDKKALQEACRL